ncbi:unnamed protein product [Heterobilharzia americana]|nr:unnamed protein product [Heterobilharzia americana]
MYPGVCGCYLPRLITHLTSCLIEKLQGNCEDGHGYHHQASENILSREINSTDYRLTRSEWASIIGCLDTIVHHIREYVVTMFDQLSIPVNFKRQIENNQISEELMIIAKAVGQFRRFLGIFCVHVLNFSPMKMNEFVHKICMDQCQQDVFLINEEHKMNSKCGTLEEEEEEEGNRVKLIPKHDYHSCSSSLSSSSSSSSSSSLPVSFIDLFANICRLIVEMSNFPLPIFHQSTNSPKVANITTRPMISNNFYDHFNLSFLDHFGGELIQHSESGDLTAKFTSDSESTSSENKCCSHYYSLGQFILPQWLVCLLYASGELNDFDIKSIALYTLIELFHAAVSIHGWNTEFNYPLKKTNGANNDQPIDLNNNNNVTSNDSDRMEVPLTDSKQQTTHQGMRLIFPVLSGELMAYLCQKTNLFTYLGVSLWNYLSPEYSAFHEDTASLLVRLHQLAPPLPKSTYDIDHLTPGPSGFSSTVSSCIEGFILSQMLSSNLHIQINAYSRFILLWHLMRYYGSRIQSNSNGLGSSVTTNSVQQFTSLNKRTTCSPVQNSFQMSGFCGSMAAVSWRRNFLGSACVEKYGIDASFSSLGLYDIPFYRCTLLLLDNLDYDNPCGPVGSIGSVGLLNSQMFQCNAKLNVMDNRCNRNDEKDDNCQEHDQIEQPNGFSNAVLREQSIVWMEKALRTGQVDRLIAPILVALLHPATARISLKAHVLKHYYQQMTAVKQSKTLNTTSKTLQTKEAVSEICDMKVKQSDLKTEISRPNQSVQSEKFNNLINSIHARFRRRCSLDESVDEKDMKDIHNTKQQVAEAVLNSVLSIRLMQTEESNSLLDYVTDWHEDSGPLSMLPVNEHVLVYLQNYDSNQVIYAFSRLRAILCIAPGLFVRSLASCTINSLLCFNFYGLNFVELLSRHRRSLGGYNFYTNATSDELSYSLQAYTNLLELIIDLCLQYMCSYLPYITTTTTITTNNTSSTDNVDNGSVNFGRRHAAEILELIVKQLICIQDECINSSMMDSLLKCNSSSTLSSVKHVSSTTRTSETSLYAMGSVLSNSLTFPSILHQFNERRLVQNTLYHTCLPSVVLHCLASCITKVHWPKNNHKIWSDYSTSNGIRKLPTCLQLILVNDLLSNLPNTFHTTQLQMLLKLFNGILHLRPWYGYSDRMSLVKHQQQQQQPQNQSSAESFYYNSLLWPVCQGILLDSESTIHDLPMHCMADIWSKACNKLPKCINREPLFRTNCLTALWYIPKTASNTSVERDQVSLFTELLSIGLSSPDHLTECGNSSFLIARLDLHLIWYRFVFDSLSYWGWFVGSLVRVTVKQACLSLNKLSDRALQDIQAWNTMSSHRRSQLSNSAEWNLLPPDYTLTSLALIQGICHAFLLPGGNATLSAMSLSRKVPPPQTSNPSRVNPPSTGYLSGLPDSIECAVEIAEILSHHKSNPPTSSGPSIETTNIVPVFDPLFPSPLTENVDNCSNPITVNSSTDGISTTEPAVILTSGGTSDDKPENKEVPVHSPNATVIFLNRVKNSQNVNIKDDILNPDYHPFIQAQSELLRLMPDIFTSLSMLWNAFNQSPLCQSIKTNFYKSTAVMNSRYPDKEHCPSLMISIPPERLPSLISLGSASLVRGAIRRLVKPIAAQHPDLVLLTSAVAWPNTIFDSETGGLLPGSDTLVNYGPLDMLIPIRMRNDSGTSESYSIPLHQKQTSLLDLMIGRTYDDKHFGPVLPATILINNLRDSIRRPMNNTFLSNLINSGYLSQNTNSVLSSSTLFSSTSMLSSSQDVNTTSGCKVLNGNSALNIIRLQICLLHLFYAWLIMRPDFISSDLLLILMRDLINMPVMINFNSVNTSNSTSSSSTGLPPVAIFILIKIFSKLLETATANDDKREQKELQELCHRLLEATASIAASALHQPSWFRKTLQVRQIDGDLNSTTTNSIPSSNSVDLVDRISLSGSEMYETNLKSDRIGTTSSLTNSYSCTTQQSNGTNCVSSNDTGCSTKGLFYDNFYNSTLPLSSSSLCRSKSRHSSLNLFTNEVTRIRMRNDVTIQAIELLTENMAIFLDLVYRSDEKDRVSTFLNNILYNIFPYLRVRMLSNSDHFTVASKLIASISSYQYTRKSWRRDVLDLFYEPVFFQMSPVALQSWNLIIDNLMTQDKSTFKEALARLVFAQPGGLNLFTNKETEYELRAACLKKLSYLVYASEPDQYAKAMPDLLERLTECLRLGQGIIPVVHAHVFLFARVLISRMSAMQLTSLWPIVIPELFLTFKSLSQTIHEHISRIHTKKLKSDSSSSTFLSASQMNLYLGACKFLATSLLCPESKVPQFSYYQWVFVKNFTLDDLPDHGKVQEITGSNNRKAPSFVPLLTDVLIQIEKLQEVDISNGIDMTSVDNTLTLYQGCFNLLALDKLINIFALKPFLESLKNNSNIDSSKNVSVNDCPLRDNFLLELALEASLAQEFPEAIASR